MVLFRQRKGSLDRIPADDRVREDKRPITGASATLSNVGPERAPASDEEQDIIEGTSSGAGVTGKPPRGSIERGLL